MNLWSHNLHHVLLYTRTRFPTGINQHGSMGCKERSQFTSVGIWSWDFSQRVLMVGSQSQWQDKVSNQWVCLILLSLFYNLAKSFQTRGMRATLQALFPLHRPSGESGVNPAAVRIELGSLLFTSLFLKARSMLEHFTSRNRTCLEQLTLPEEQAQLRLAFPLCEFFPAQVVRCNPLYWYWSVLCTMV